MKIPLRTNHFGRYAIEGYLIGAARGFRQSGKKLAPRDAYAGYYDPKPGDEEYVPRRDRMKKRVMKMLWKVHSYDVPLTVLRTKAAKKAYRADVASANAEMAERAYAGYY